MAELSSLIAEINPIAQAYKMLHELETASNAEADAAGIPRPDINMAIVQNRNSDPRRYNAPRFNEVAVVFENPNGEPPLERDLLIHCRNGNRYCYTYKRALLLILFFEQVRKNVVSRCEPGPHDLPAVLSGGPSKLGTSFTFAS